MATKRTTTTKTVVCRQIILIYFLSLDWPVIYSSLMNSTSNTKLKWFQYRILYKVQTTNDYLNKRKVTDSDRCTFCKSEQETISHLLWDCTYTDLLEARFRRDQKEHTSYTYSMLLSKWLFLA